jgi:hypothetical protein
VTDGRDAAAIRRLVERLHRLGPPVPSEGPTTSGETPSADEAGTASRGQHDFLAPPAGPGEIGRLGRYRILKQLGSGGMGIVFQAEDPRLKRIVAVKVLKPESADKPRARARFLREAQSVAGLEHEHVVTIYGGAVIRIATNRGQLVIEVDDPQVEVTVKEKGAVIQDRPGQRVITLAAGEHEVEVTITDAIGKARFFTRKLTLERGGKVIVNAWEELAQARAKAAPIAKDDPDRRAAEWVLSIGGEACDRRPMDRGRERLACGPIPRDAR